MTEIEVILASAPTVEVRQLVGELEAVLSAEYPIEQRHGLKLEAIFQPHMRFFVARLDGIAVGCGGVALLDGIAEVKRMYVHPSARGRGVAQAILARLEVEARAVNCRVLARETGDRQLDALRLYRQWGFADAPPFGDYRTLPPHSIATSIFMQKTLTERNAVCGF
jgi:putative acetyltransferase